MRRGGEKIKTTDFFDIAVLGKYGENCANYFAKDKQVCIDGRIKYYEHEKDGVNRVGYSFIANNILFLSKRGDHVIES
ncbi:MAG: single-stranded DNA-binding protein [bacterium]